MAEHNPDILIFGGGVAALWSLAYLREQGYDALLLCNEPLGGWQTLSSQGILHAGLKYALSGAISPIAMHIRNMPELWLNCMNGKGAINLKGAHMRLQGQNLLVPAGLMAGPMNIALQGIFGAQKLDAQGWPAALDKTGFKGHVLRLKEPVLDVPQTIATLHHHYKDFIRQIDFSHVQRLADNRLQIGSEIFNPRCIIFAAGAGNLNGAALMGHESHIKIRRRPLLMGFLKPAPFEIYAHLLGYTDKPLATITTHVLQDGTMCWYIGGQVAERSKEDNPNNLYSAMKKALYQFFPQLDLSALQAACLPVDRVEGTDTGGNHPPDEPSINAIGSVIYAWPTKMTFAPLLAQRLEKVIQQMGISPSGGGHVYTGYATATLAPPPWNNLTWTKF
ncbi:MAG: hypothetical protein L6Q57_04665 [Alphaproteobacteria bacterium]|nr:hypothetical protein [Alphaproteobacteria bacterium]